MSGCYAIAVALAQLLKGQLYESGPAGYQIQFFLIVHYVHVVLHFNVVQTWTNTHWFKRIFTAVLWTMWQGQPIAYTKGFSRVTGVMNEFLLPMFMTVLSMLAHTQLLHGKLCLQKASFIVVKRPSAVDDEDMHMSKNCWTTFPVEPLKIQTSAGSSFLLHCHLTHQLQLKIAPPAFGPPASPNNMVQLLHWECMLFLFTCRHTALLFHCLERLTWELVTSGQQKPVEHFALSVMWQTRPGCQPVLSNVRPVQIPILL